MKSEELPSGSLLKTKPATDFARFEWKRVLATSMKPGVPAI